MKKQESAERVNVYLDIKARRALQELVERNGITKTEAISRAVVAYAYLDERVQCGLDVVVRGDGQEQLLRFL